MNILSHPYPSPIAALPMLLACAIAHAQDDPGALDRMVRADAARWLCDSDPVVRGEATLVVASLGEERFHTAVLATARDADLAARLRGIVAVGLQATAGSETVLDDILGNQGRLDEPEGVCAAFALGLLPPDRAPAVTSRVLTSFLRTNLRRQRDTLMALLLGLGQHEQPLQVSALRRLFDDESVRDPGLRAQLLTLLLPVDRAMDAARLRRLLERGGPEERGALLDWLGHNTSPFDGELRSACERLARDGADPVERARALAVLTRLHHPPALDLAAHALRSSHAVESAQGMRSVLTLGGATLRESLERHLVADVDPARKAALLAAFDAPPSAELRDHAARLATDGKQPMPLRIAAARLLARADAERAQPILRDLFATSDEPALLAQLASDLRRVADLPAAERLLGGTADVRLHPARWRAMLDVEHPTAVRQLLADLVVPDARVRARALALWRAARVVATPSPVFGPPPAVLVALLGT